MKRDPGDGDDAGPRVHPPGDVAGGDPALAALRLPALDAAFLEREPGVGVRREFHVVGHDVVPFLPGEGARDEVQAPARVWQERNLLARGAEEARGPGPGRLDGGV